MRPFPVLTQPFLNPYLPVDLRFGVETWRKEDISRLLCGGAICTRGSVCQCSCRGRRMSAVLLLFSALMPLTLHLSLNLGMDRWPNKPPVPHPTHSASLQVYVCHRDPLSCSDSYDSLQFWGFELRSIWLCIPFGPSPQS